MAWWQIHDCSLWGLTAENGRTGVESERAEQDGMSEDLFDLRGQAAIVTGASRGLGQYFGRALARAGADLVVTSRRREALGPFVAEIESIGRRAVPPAVQLVPPLLRYSEPDTSQQPRAHLMTSRAWYSSALCTASLAITAAAAS